MSTTDASIKICIFRRSLILSSTCFRSLPSKARISSSVNVSKDGGMGGAGKPYGDKNGNGGINGGSPVPGAKGVVFGGIRLPNGLLIPTK